MPRPSNNPVTSVSVRLTLTHQDGTVTEYCVPKVALLDPDEHELTVHVEHEQPGVFDPTRPARPAKPVLLEIALKGKPMPEEKGGSWMTVTTLDPRPAEVATTHTD